MSQIQTTLVSAVPPYFVTQKHIRYIQFFVALPVSKLIFVHSTILEFILQSVRFDPKTTIFAPYDRTFIDEYLPHLAQYDKYSYEPVTELSDLVFQNSKLEILCKAIHANPFGSSHFIWLNVDIREYLSSRIGDANLRVFHELIANVVDKFAELYPRRIRVGSMWNLDVASAFNVDLFRVQTRFFTETVFGGHGSRLVKFANRYREKCIQIADRQKNRLTWFSNVVFLVWTEDGGHSNRSPGKSEFVFSVYGCVENEKAIENYLYGL